MNTEIADNNNGRTGEQLEILAVGMSPARPGPQLPRPAAKEIAPIPAGLVPKSGRREPQSLKPIATPPAPVAAEPPPVAVEPRETTRADDYRKVPVKFAAPRWLARSLSEMARLRAQPRGVYVSNELQKMFERYAPVVRGKRGKK